MPDRDIRWGTVRGDCGNWAFFDGESGEPYIIWRSKVKASVIAPPVAGKGAIFIGTPIRRLFVFDAETGDRLSKLWVDISVEDGMALDDNLIALSGRSFYNKLSIYDIDKGDLVWSKSSDRSSTPPLICDSQLFFATSEGVVFRIDPKSGEKIWRIELKDAVIEQEMAYRDSILYLPDQNGSLFAISADSGKIKWKLPLPTSPSGAVVVIPDHIIVPTVSGEIPVIKLDGSIRVSIDAPGELVTSLACSGPTVYGATRFGIVFAGDLGGGGILWQTNLDIPLITPPVLWGRELVIVTTDNRLLFLSFADGEILHELKIDSHLGTPPIIYNGNLYLGTLDGELIAIGKKTQSMERENE